MLGVEESSFLVLESGQRLVPELVLEVEETVAGKGKKGILLDQLSWQKSINKHIIIDYIYDKPVVQGKVLDLVQCQQWSAGGLGCLVGLLRRALSPVW